VPPAPSAAAPPAATSASAAAAPEPSLDDKSLEDLLGDEDFAKQLQAGMADLLGEFDKNVCCLGLTSPPLPCAN
jgi:peroxin-19